MKILLDAGHGYSTPGKRSPDGMKEYEFNRAVAYIMKTELEKYEGVTVYMAHDDSRDVPLRERTDKANRLGVNLYFSIHANASTGQMGAWGGIDSFIYKTNPADARKIAEVVQRNLIAATGLRNRGVKCEDFHVLRETHMTAILVEHGFMDSVTDLPLLKSDAYRVLCGQTNAKSIAEVYGLKLKKEAVKVADKPKPQNDISGHWAESSIEAVKAAGLMSGFADGTFRPNEPLTRAQFAVSLERLLNSLNRK
jgi:N-acetylmuramoyl-L-alanine amidase